MKQQALRSSSLLVSLIQRLDNQIGVRLFRHRPAHHPARAKIQHDSQVMPFPLGPNVGDIAAPHLVGCRDIELPIQDVISGVTVVSIYQYFPIRSILDDMPAQLEHPALLDSLVAMAIGCLRPSAVD
ncbi:hypothetical protein HA62_28260 [Pseudomonas putida]|nr:hypothetical protein HA62_28260 [Pseudomonas putida]